MNKFSRIEDAFNVLKSSVSINYTVGTQMIKETLCEEFKGYNFDIVLVSKEMKDDEFFIMSIYPEKQTIDKIIEAIIKNQEEKVIVELWKKNKNWILEIDTKLFDDRKISINGREFTALILHELGHIAFSNSIVSRLSTIMRYEISKAQMSTKILFRSGLFRTILSIPIIDACVADKSNSFSNLNTEVKADNFVRSKGYTKELYSVLNKILEKNKNNGSLENGVINSTQFSINTMNDLQARRDRLVKNSLLSIRESATPYGQEILDDFINLLFESPEDRDENYKINYMMEKAKEFENDELMREFSIFGGKRLKRIDPSEMDYIFIKSQSMKTTDDKMLLITYARSKLDIVNYYINILLSPTESKKYSIPHTLTELYQFRDRLNKSIDYILNYKLPVANKELIIRWPTGYEG